MPPVRKNLPCCAPTGFALSALLVSAPTMKKGERWKAKNATWASNLCRFVLACNGLAHHAHEGFFVNHEPHYVAVNFGDFANDAGIGDDFHPLAQAFLEFLGLFLPLHLRANEEKVKNNENQERE